MNNLSLWGIGEELQKIKYLLDQDNADDPEIKKEKVQLKESLFLLLKTKTDGCCQYMQMETDLANLADNKIKELEAYKKARLGKIEKFCEYIKMFMDGQNIDQIDGELNTIKMAKPQDIVIVEKEKDIPVEFINTKINSTPDKKKIITALKNGEIIEGVKLGKSPNRSIKFKLKTLNRK